ncbi:hypothetical protein AAE478_009543 [Parahypoxylon ruwenzoriense]
MVVKGLVNIGANSNLADENPTYAVHMDKDAKELEYFTDDFQAPNIQCLNDRYEKAEFLLKNCCADTTDLERESGVSPTLYIPMAVRDHSRCLALTNAELSHEF